MRPRVDASGLLEGTGHTEGGESGSAGMACQPAVAVVVVVAGEHGVPLPKVESEEEGKGIAVGERLSGEVSWTLSTAKWKGPACSPYVAET